MNRWHDVPLRLRLTVLYAGLLGVLLVALGWVIYVETRSFLIASTERRQRAQAAPVIAQALAAESPGGGPPAFVESLRGDGGANEAADIGDTDADADADAGGTGASRAPGPPSHAGPPHRNLDRLAPALAHALSSPNTAALILDPDGTVLADGRDQQPGSTAAPVESDRVAAAVADNRELSYTTQVEGQLTLVTLIPLQAQTGSPAVLGVAQLSTPLDLAEEVLSRERFLLLIGVPLALGLGTLGCFWLTSTTVAPLRVMVQTCRRIAAGDLGGRVGLPRRRDEVGQLAAAFDEMAERIAEGFAVQRRFVADAAHELRTPLTALVGSLEVLRRGAQDDPETAAPLIDSMHREVQRLERLAEHLLDLSRLEARAPLAMRPVEVGAFFADVAGPARALARGRDLRIVTGEPVTVAADPDRLQQAMLHLIDNASRHTPADGTIEMGWRTGVDWLELWVADDGDGIATADLPHVFEPFFRGDRSRSRRDGGTGLGLALVQAVTLAHGGRVDVVSQPGAGARFTVSLPANGAALVSGLPPA